MVENLITVIVPVYNVEKYLDRCISSILNQTYKKLEIILIDDGSTDTSGKLCDMWSAKDKRIVVKHTENQGVGAARNIALDLANGEYIAFVDADDWIEGDMYQQLLNGLQESDADVCVGGYVFSTIGQDLCSFRRKKVEIYDRISTLQAVFSGKRHPIMGWELCDKLFRSWLFEGIRFKSTLKMAEDKLMFWNIIKRTNKVCCLPLYKYHYFMRESSAVHTVDIKAILDDVWVAKYCLNESFLESTEIKKFVELRYFITLIASIRKLALLPKSNERDKCMSAYVDVIRKNSVAIMLSKCDMIYKLGCIYACIPYKSKRLFLFLVKKIKTVADIH